MLPAIFFGAIPTYGVLPYAMIMDAVETLYDTQILLVYNHFHERSENTLFAIIKQPMYSVDSIMLH